MRIAVAGGTGAVGTMAVAEARARGHEVRVLSRAAGVDLTGPEPLDLVGTEVVVDVLSANVRSAADAIEFFTRTTGALLDAERRSGVGHHVALSIVGIDRAPYDYYAGKLAQEQAVVASGVPWTLLRATQFHEFAEQMLTRARFGPLQLAPRMRTQPVAAHEVAARLVDLAEQPPAGRVPDLAGPREEWLPRMVRACARARGRRMPIPAVSLPGPFGRAMRDGSLLAGPEAVRGAETFDAWLARTRG
ncbi:SDR family oxidoreductase [Microbacterium sp. SORGH_AS_0888]|uniref:SDR family oxidoreductase n=1 Tax=Microbacterium sp. SORGH_AS_0888 TaxID=3041791 RepID=UPI002788566D|nr:SDR family oxidoreductase [Microbacterium sp. SORGH_AS_0888]MDQ1130594.1 uncharacterized protein YbjT (DUF2867 family) [Microbacterium sp. SORGH_AS_0888]